MIVYHTFGDVKRRVRGTGKAVVPITSASTEIPPALPFSKGGITYGLFVKGGDPRFSIHREFKEV
jgi:hypothetical protein